MTVVPSPGEGVVIGVTAVGLHDASFPVSREQEDEVHGPVIVIDGHASWKRWFADLYVYRGALQSLALRNVRSRYKQAALGMTWALVQPAVQVGVFTVLFGMLAKIPTGGVPYPIFALAGLLPWNLFNRITNDGAASLVTNQGIITKLFFPRIFLVLAAGGSALLDACVTVLLLIALLVFYHIAPTMQLWLALPALAGVLLFSFGFASLLAALNARWRDVQHTLPFMLQIGMFVTPVVYQNTLVPAPWRWLLALNPLTGLIDVFRAALLGTALPAGWIVSLSLAMSAGMTVAGVWFFRRSEATIVDVV
jgi:lipopolysaccharide transport system permease protein